MISDLVTEYTRSTYGSGSEGWSRVKVFLAKVALIPDAEEQILQGLNRMVDAECWREGAAWLAAASKRVDQRYLEPMVKLLEKRTVHSLNEMAVELLMDIADPSVVPVLRQVIGYESPKDPFNHLPIKALEALVEIGGVEAKAVVREVALNDHRDVVREEAEDCLQDFD